MKQRVKVIGIAGGIASGKSTAAKMLVSLGADIIDADKICHRLINTKDIVQKITDRWGDHLKNEHGKIERHKLGKIVFADKKELTALNKIIHPNGINRIKSRIANLKDEATTKAIVLDAALLVESNLIDICDIMLFVNTKKSTCKTRVQESRKWPLDEITKRENSKIHYGEKGKLQTLLLTITSLKRIH